jgi:hypothetical protein
VAEIEVGRLKEAAENAGKLQALAEEIAEAKAKTDTIVISLVDARD